MTNFDFAKLDELQEKQESGVEVPIRHPVTNEDLGFYITVAGLESERVKKAQRKQVNENLKRQSRKLTAEQIEVNARKLQVATVLSWRFAEGVTIGGEQPECTPENVEAIFKRFPFIAEQVDSVIGDRSAFLTS